ncbi:acyltransferase [Shewanella baltica]|uniref:acyltransferase n=1 Tax=Shewanella baltica TaxID=62322 RepID=UPI003984BAC1
MKNYLRSISEKKEGKLYFFYLFFLYCKKYSVFGPIIFFLMLLYSYFISFRLFGFSFFPKVCFSNGIYRIKINIGKASLVKFIDPEGLIIFERWRAGVATTITVNDGATLEFGSSFVIGDNCKISLFKNSRMVIMGKSTKQSSGITADTIILCFEEIFIGEGTIISWNCYLSDSNQHEVNGLLKIQPIRLGYKVWLSEGVTCGPGTVIGSGSIVGAKSFVNKEYPERVFIVGSPGKIKSSNIDWNR